MNELERIAKRLNGLIVRSQGLAAGLWGPPGIGKTHTVKHLLRQTPCRNLSLHVTAVAPELVLKVPRPTKLSIWAERTLDRVHRGDHVEPSSLLDTLGAMLGGLAPFILHLEDVHEASPEQLEFVQALAQMVGRLKGVGLIVTSREPPPEGFEVLRLGPLTADEAARMLETEAGASLPAEALSWVFSRTMGNPLFALEFFRFLSRQGFLWNDTQRWRWREPERETMPVTVEVLIEHVIAGVVSKAAFERVIHAKAMLGRGVSQALWAEVAGLELDALRTAMVELEREGILAGEEFAHPLYAEVIAHNLPPERRRLLARRAIEVLEDVPEAAAEFVDGAELEPGVALALLDRAIHSARDGGDQVQSARFQIEASKHLTGEARGRLALEAAQVLRTVNKSEAITALKMAVQACPTDHQAAYQLAQMLAVQGKLEQAEALLDHVSNTLEPRLMWRYRAVVRALAQDYAATVQIWRNHPEICENSDGDVIYQVAFSLNALSEKQAAMNLVWPHLERDDLSPLDKTRFLSVLAISHFYMGDYQRSSELFKQALQVAQENNLIEPLAFTTMNHSHVLGQLGQIDAQIEAIELAAKSFAELGLVKQHTYAQASLANMYAHLGDFERAEAMLLECHQTLSAMSPSDALCDCEHHLSCLYRDWESPHGGVLSLKYARALLNTGRRLNSPRNIARGLLDLASAENALGRAQQAFELADQVREMNERLGSPWGVWRAIEEQARAVEALGRPEQAIELFASAEAGMQAIGATEATHRIGLELGRLTGNLDRAVHHLEYFQAHRHAVGIARALRCFPHLGRASTLPVGVLAIHPIRLEVLGSMHLMTDGREVPVRGAKRRELLAVLLEARVAGRAEIPRLDLLDALYPGVSEAQSSSALKEAVHQVREIHGPDTILTTEGGYALGAVASDAEDFLRTGETRLWRGAYLEGVHLDGSNETVPETLSLALRARAEMILETDPVEAARLGRILYGMDPYDLESLRLLLQALRASKNHKSLVRAYVRARERLLEIGEVLPSAWAAFLQEPVGAMA